MALNVSRVYIYILFSTGKRLTLPTICRLDFDDVEWFPVVIFVFPFHCKNVYWRQEGIHVYIKRFPSTGNPLPPRIVKYVPHYMSYSSEMAVKYSLSNQAPGRTNFIFCLESGYPSMWETDIFRTAIRNPHRKHQRKDTTSVRVRNK